MENAGRPSNSTIFTLRCYRTSPPGEKTSDYSALGEENDEKRNLDTLKTAELRF